MKVRKILFINRRLSVGGAERVMTLLANATAKRGIETDMVCSPRYGTHISG